MTVVREEPGARVADDAVAVAGALLRRTLGGLPGRLPGVTAAQARSGVTGRGPVAIDADDERAVQAACGVMHVHGRATGGPVPLPVGYVSAVAGVLSAQAATACLLARWRGYPPLRPATSLAQGALLAVGQYLAAATAHGAPGEPGEPAWAEAAPAPGLATLTTADGVAVEIETLDPAAWCGFWARLGVPAKTAGRGWGPFQQRFATAVCPLPDALRDAVRAVDARRVREAGRASGVSVAVVPVDDTAAPDVPPWLLEPDGSAAPDTRPRALGPGGRGAGGVPGGRGPGGPLPLSGVRVVESTRRVQGPMAGHVLRLLGAEVIRVEPPGGDPMRGLPPLAGDCSARFTALNAGKTVVEADLTTARGRRTVRELVSGADVFTHTWAPGKAEAFGLDAPALRAVRPGLVYASASGFGDALGPCPPIGTDYLAQVHGGLATAVRPAGEPPAPSLMTLTDVLGGLVLAQAALAGLAVRERTGRGSRAESSLLSAAALVPRPPRRVRLTPLDLPLPTADGLLCLGATARERPGEVARVTGASGLASLPARLRERGTDEWLARLREAGLPSVRVRTDLSGLAADPAFARAVLPPDPRTPCARPAPPWHFEEA